MRNLIYAVLAIVFLTGCPKKEEIQKMQNDLSEKKGKATEAIETRNFSLEGLLEAQDYFFSFSERVHLLIVEEKGVSDMKKLIKSKGIKSFCTTFVMPVSQWQPLETYCSAGQLYKCSPEIKEYANTVEKLKELLGTSFANSFSSEPTCNN